MSRVDFMNELARCTKNERKIDLPDEILEGRAEFLFTVYEAIHGHLTPSELNQSYIIMAGLLLGKYPKIAHTVQSHDRVRLPYVALEQLPASKGKLTKQERLIFAFCTFYSVCVEVCDEDTGEIHKGIREINSNEHAISLMLDDMENHPERYEFLKAPGKSHAPKTSGPLGSRDNPVKAVSIADGYSYLNSLRDKAGNPVKYSRNGSLPGNNGGIIDMYTLYFGGGTMMLYIDPYSAENSTQAPDGLTISGDDELENLIEAAKNGDGSAQFQLGLKYYNGEGVRQDYCEALKWYRLSAEQGYLSAITNIGLMYSRGHGVEQSYSEAAKWYALAVEDEFPDALHNLGFLYENGLGVRQDINRASELWRKAAEKGHMISQFNVGLLCEEAGNDNEAAKWMRKSAEQGYMQAQHNLGRMYEQCIGVERNIDEAVKWYRLAAKQGNETSLKALQRLGKF